MSQVLGHSSLYVVWDMTGSFNSCRKKITIKHFSTVVRRSADGELQVSADFLFSNTEYSVASPPEIAFEFKVTFSLNKHF